MKKGLIFALMATVVVLLCFGFLWNGALSQAGQDMNNSVALNSPNRAGVDIGNAVNAGFGTIVYPAAVLVLGALAMMGLWMFAKAVSNK